MDKRIIEKEQELKDIIGYKVDEIYEEAHEIIGTIGGDMTPNQALKLNNLKDELFKQVAEQVEQNLPKIPLTVNDVLKVIKPQIINKIDFHDFEKIISEQYGGDFEVTAVEEVYNNSKVQVIINEGDEPKSEVEKEIRAGNYPQYCTKDVALCLYKDGLLLEGIYQIDVSW